MPNASVFSTMRCQWGGIMPFVSIIVRWIDFTVQVFFFFLGLLFPRSLVSYVSWFSQVFPKLLLQVFPRFLQGPLRRGVATRCEGVFCWNSLPGLQRHMCLCNWLKEVKLSSLRITSHEAEQRVIGEEGSSWTESGWSCDWGKSGAAEREESVRDVEEIFGASISRKGTLNSALINFKEQELLEVKVIQACYPRVQPSLSIEVPFPRGNFRSRIGNGTWDKD